jgi:hypothetical protein
MAGRTDGRVGGMPSWQGRSGGLQRTALPLKLLRSHAAITRAEAAEIYQIEAARAME